jgi:hypothetical protein
LGRNGNPTLRLPFSLVSRAGRILAIAAGICLAASLAIIVWLANFWRSWLHTPR